VDWYYGYELNETVHRYHDHHAGLPQFQQAQLLHLHVLEEIRKYVSSHGQSKVFRHWMESIEDAGLAGDSAADGGSEFRVHFIMVSITVVIADNFVDECASYFTHKSASENDNGCC